MGALADLLRLADVTVGEDGAHNGISRRRHVRRAPCAYDAGPFIHTNVRRSGVRRTRGAQVCRTCPTRQCAFPLTTPTEDRTARPQFPPMTPAEAVWTNPSGAAARACCPSAEPAVWGGAAPTGYLHDLMRLAADEQMQQSVPSVSLPVFPGGIRCAHTLSPSLLFLLPACSPQVLAAPTTLGTQVLRRHHQAVGRLPARPSKAAAAKGLPQ